MDTGSKLVFLIGYRGSGKTTVARLLAERLGWSWCDADALLEARFGRSIREIFAEEGESGFRDKEAQLLTDLCQSREQVIATGGGIVLRPENRANLRTGLVIWLSADAEILHQRIQKDTTSGERRPPLAQGGLAEVRELLDRRRPFYAECADHVIDTGSLTPDEIVARIMDSIG